MDNWKKFWNGLSPIDKRLFRVLQKAYRELGENKQMFSYNYLSVKEEIRQYVQDVFEIDIDNLPK